MSKFQETLNKEFFVGVFVTIGFILLLGSIYTIEGLGEAINDKKIVKVQFDYLGGLKTGQPVLYAGYQVGSVRSVTIREENPPRIVTDLAVPKRLPIYTNTEFLISSSGLIGDKVVDILPPDEPAQKPGQNAILKGESPVNLSKMLGKLRSVFGGGTRSKIRTTVNNAVRLTENLANLSERMRGITINNEDRINRILRNLSDSSKRLPGLITRADEAARSLDQLAQQLSQISGENRPQLRKIIQNPEATSRNLENFSKDIKASPSVLFWGK